LPDEFQVQAIARLFLGDCQRIDLRFHQVLEKVRPIGWFR
jgi:hypothetical protein